MRLYEHDPSFKSKEELEHFLEGCDNRIKSESDSEEFKPWLVQGQTSVERNISLFSKVNKERKAKIN